MVYWGYNLFRLRLLFGVVIHGADQGIAYAALFKHSQDRLIVKQAQSMGKSCAHRTDSQSVQVASKHLRVSIHRDVTRRLQTKVATLYRSTSAHSSAFETRSYEHCIQRTALQLTPVAHCRWPSATPNWRKPDTSWKTSKFSFNCCCEMAPRA